MHNLPLLIEPEQLLERLHDPALLIVDVSSQANYDAGHIPGALSVLPAQLQSGLRPAVGQLPATADLNHLLGNLGLSQDRHVVAYDDEGGGWAGRFIWTLDAVGHNNCSYLNGGIHAWRAAGLPVSQEQATARPTSFDAQLNTAVIAEADDILRQLGDPELGIWDARSAEEYAGTKVLAQRAGHIPGAVNIDWLELMDRQRDMRLVDLDMLADRLRECGLGPEKRIVTHCQSHHRSGLSYLVMKILGYPDIKGYHGSWSEWGNRDDTPIES